MLVLFSWIIFTYTLGHASPQNLWFIDLVLSCLFWWHHFFFFLVLQNSGLLHEMLESTNADSKSWKVCLMILLLFNLYSSLIIITHCVANIDLFVLEHKTALLSIFLCTKFALFLGIGLLNSSSIYTYSRNVSLW